MRLMLERCWIVVLSHLLKVRVLVLEEQTMVHCEYVLELIVWVDLLWIAFRRGLWARLELLILDRFCFVEMWICWYRSKKHLRKSSCWSVRLYCNGQESESFDGPKIWTNVTIFTQKLANFWTWDIIGGQSKHDHKVISWIWDAGHSVNGSEHGGRSHWKIKSHCSEELRLLRLIFSWYPNQSPADRLSTTTRFGRMHNTTNLNSCRRTTFAVWDGTYSKTSTIQSSISRMSSPAAHTSKTWLLLPDHSYNSSSNSCSRQRHDEKVFAAEGGSVRPAQQWFAPCTSTEGAHRCTKISIINWIRSVERSQRLNWEEQILHLI